MISMLWDGATVAEIVEETGLHATTVNDFIQCLRQNKTCYKESKVPDIRGYYTITVYKLGRNKDVKYVPPKTPAERGRERRAKAKQLEITQRLTGTYTQNSEV